MLFSYIKAIACGVFAMAWGVIRSTGVYRNPPLTPSVASLALGLIFSLYSSYIQAYILHPMLMYFITFVKIFCARHHSIYGMAAGVNIIPC